MGEDPKKSDPRLRANLGVLESTVESHGLKLGELDRRVEGHGRKIGDLEQRVEVVGDDTRPTAKSIPKAPRIPEIPPPPSRSPSHQEFNDAMVGVALYLAEMKKAQEEKDAAQNQVLVLFAEKIGIDPAKLPPLITSRSVPPPPMGNRPRAPTSLDEKLDRVRHMNLRQLLVELVLALLNIAILLKVLVDLVKGH